MATARSRKSVKQDVIGEGDFPCGPCGADNRTCLAVGYCQFCRHYLCKSCFTYHQNLGKAHVLLGKDAMPQAASTPASSLDPLLETCAEHKHKTLELYCKGHDEVCCVICATGRHKNCDYIYIPDFTSSLTNSPTDDCETILKLIKALISQLEFVKSESGKRVKDMDKQKREFILAVRKYRKEVDIVLDQLEKQVISGMKQVVEIGTKDLNDNIAQCEDALKALQDTATRTEAAVASDSLNRVFTVSKTSHKLLQENNGVLKAVRDNSYTVDIKFEENGEILKCMRRMKMFGKVSVKKDPVKFEDEVMDLNGKNTQNGKAKPKNDKTESKSGEKSEN